jgi:hypothetical protein
MAFSMRFGMKADQFKISHLNRDQLTSNIFWEVVQSRVTPGNNGRLFFISRDSKQFPEEYIDERSGTNTNRDTAIAAG